MAAAKHRGYAFITFQDPADAQDAIDNYDLNEMPGFAGRGKFLKCSIAAPNKFGTEGQGDKFDRPGELFFLGGVRFSRLCTQCLCVLCSRWPLPRPGNQAFSPVQDRRRSVPCRTALTYSLGVGGVVAETRTARGTSGSPGERSGTSCRRVT